MLAATSPPVCASAGYRSGSGTVRAELCRPAGARGSVPAVLVLHGCGGSGSLDRSLAQELPRAGIATLHVDYFSETPPAHPGHGFCGGGGGRDGRNVFLTWQ